MSKNTKEVISEAKLNTSDKKETPEEKRKRLKEKLRQKMEQKRVGRLNNGQKKEQLNKYCNQLGITPEQLEQFKSMGEQLQKLKNNNPYI